MRTEVLHRKGLGGDFTPGVERARAAGYKIEVRPYVGTGEEQVQESLTVIAKKIRDGRLDPDIRGWVGDVLKAAGNPKTRRGKVSAILDAFRQSTIYVSDPDGAEYIVAAGTTMCLRPGLCVRARDCFPEGTKLLRDDFALVPIEQIKVGDRIWGRDKWTEVKAVWAKGALPVDAIEMNNGSTVYLTGDHKVYVGRCKHGNGADCWCTNCKAPSARHVSYERVHVSELLEGDVLLRPDRIDFGTKEEDPGRLYVEGLALADGWVDMPSARSFRIAGRDGKRKEAQKREVKEICDRLGIETHWHKRYITVKDPEWAKRLLTLGSRARFKRADSMNLSEEGARELLRGLMADSTANSNGPGRTYSTTSYTMMVQVRVLHRMFGVTTGIKMLTPEEHGGAGENPLWRVYVRAGTERAEKTLAVRAIDREVRTVPCWDITTEDHYVYLPEHDVTVSNCDDGVVAVGSMISSAGIHVVVVKQNFGPGKQEHVLVEAQMEDGSYIPADPSTNLPAGDKVPAVSEERIDPMDVMGSHGTSGPEIVTLGSLPSDLDPVHKNDHGEWTVKRYGQWWIHGGSGVGWVPVGTGEACCAACAEKDAAAAAAPSGTAAPLKEDGDEGECSACELWAKRAAERGELARYGVSGAPKADAGPKFSLVTRLRTPLGLGADVPGTTTIVSPTPITTPSGNVGVGAVAAVAAIVAVATGVAWGLGRREPARRKRAA